MPRPTPRAMFASPMPVPNFIPRIPQPTWAPAVAPHAQQDDHREVSPILTQEEWAARDHEFSQRLSERRVARRRAQRRNSSPQRSILDWFDASFINLANTISRTIRYPGVVTHEARLIKLYPNNLITSPFQRDSPRLLEAKRRFNEMFQNRYNGFEAVFGPNPLDGWDALVEFQQSCNSTMFQYMIHRRSCTFWDGCICHHSLNNGEGSLFKDVPLIAAAIETRKDFLLEGSYEQFMKKLDWHCISKLITLTRRVRSGEEPLVLNSPAQRQGYVISSFYTGAEHQEEEEEEDYGEDGIQAYDRPVWMTRSRTQSDDWSDLESGSPTGGLLPPPNFPARIAAATTVGNLYQYYTNR